MPQRHQLYVLLANVAVALVIVIAATVLGALHALDPQAVVAIFGTAVGLVGGTAGAIAALGTVVNGKSIMSANALAGAIAASQPGAAVSTTPGSTGVTPAPPAPPAAPPPAA